MVESIAATLMAPLRSSAGVPEPLLRIFSAMFCTAMSSFPVLRFLDPQQETCAAFLDRQSGATEMYRVE
jgi:hypothetical protein